MNNLRLVFSVIWSNCVCLVFLGARGLFFGGFFFSNFVIIYFVPYHSIKHLKAPNIVNIL